MPLSLYLISCLLQESIHISWLEEGLPGVLLHVVAQTLSLSVPDKLPPARVYLHQLVAGGSPAGTAPRGSSDSVVPGSAARPRNPDFHIYTEQIIRIIQFFRK